MNRGKCGATREGQRLHSGRIVAWRGTCRNYPLKGYEHCEFHLTLDERERYIAEKGHSPRHRP